MTESYQTLLNRLPAKVAHFKIAKRMRPSREKLRALIVEDQLFSRKLLTEVLRQKHVVWTAETAFAGLEMYLDNAPDIVFLDIMLPDESGHTLAKAIKTLEPNAYIVMVTANNSVEDVALAKSNNVDGFIIKPYSKQKIDDCIEKFLAARAPEGKAP